MTRRYSVERIGGTHAALTGSKIYAVRLLDDDAKNDWEPSDDDRTAIVYLHGEMGQHIRCERCRVEDRLYPKCGHIGALRKFLLVERGDTS